MRLTEWLHWHSNVGIFMHIWHLLKMPETHCDLWMPRLWHWSYKVVQIWPGQTVTCLHTNQSRSYLNHLVFQKTYRVVFFKGTEKFALLHGILRSAFSCYMLLIGQRDLRRGVQNVSVYILSQISINWAKGVFIRTSNTVRDFCDTIKVKLSHYRPGQA